MSTDNEILDPSYNYLWESNTGWPQPGKTWKILENPGIEK